MAQLQIRMKALIGKALKWINNEIALSNFTDIAEKLLGCNE